MIHILLGKFIDLNLIQKQDKKFARFSL